MIAVRPGEGGLVTSLDHVLEPQKISLLRNFFLD
jgi:hypothetical protein